MYLISARVTGRKVWIDFKVTPKICHIRHESSSKSVYGFSRKSDAIIVMSLIDSLRYYNELKVEKI